MQITLSEDLASKSFASGSAIFNRDRLVETLEEINEKNDLASIKKEIFNFIEIIRSSKSDRYGLLNIDSNGDTISLRRDVLRSELDQILNALTIERAKYYLKRLENSVKKVKVNKINDINLLRWKEYNDIITDSLWILDKRDNTGVHSAGYWGNFIPQIPNQFLKRYTKKGEWVLDPFLGCGTTLIECQRLGRNGIGIELQPSVVQIAKSSIEKELNPFSVQCKTIVGDSTELDFKKILKDNNVKSVQFLLMHPPYWDIIKFSQDKKDLSNAKSLAEFLELFGKVVENTYPILEKNRYFAVVIGDKYSAGKWIPLGFYTMQEILKKGYTLKSIIVKNFEETKGKRNQKELWRYRALVGGFYIFKHEYIFLFKKA